MPRNQAAAGEECLRTEQAWLQLIPSECSNCSCHSPPLASKLHEHREHVLVPTLFPMPTKACHTLGFNKCLLTVWLVSQGGASFFIPFLSSSPITPEHIQS